MMLNYQIVIAANMCAARIRERSSTLFARRHENPQSVIERWEHVLWMRDQVALEMVPKGADASKREKAMRWLGFMQGVLWVDGLATLEELKDWNRG